MLTNARFNVILADPAWNYDQWTQKKNGAVIAHYATMSTSDIAAIPVSRWANEDCVLALWGTWPKLPDAVEVMNTWGFEYVTGLPWIKTLPKSGDIYTGIGFWWQSCSELLLIGRKGKPKVGKLPILALLNTEQRQFYAPRTRHSAKPLGIHEWIEKKISGPYLELFARNKREGWTTWGLELGFHLSSEGVKEVGTKEEQSSGTDS